MAKVITFSRYFPSYHPRKGEPTFFAEKVMAAFAELPGYDGQIPKEFTDWDWYEYYNGVPKWHTIRAGKRFKDGDMFSPRIWTGKPYQSKQQVLWSHDIKVEKTYDVSILNSELIINEHPIITARDWINVAKNDGLNVPDLQSWFKIQNCSFEGQIICWNKNILY